MHCYILFAVKRYKIENGHFQSGICADAQSSLIYEKAAEAAEWEEICILS